MQLIVKRIFDFVAAAMGLVLLAPAMGVVVLAIRIALKEPSIFRQMRIGRNAEAFEVLKFRTMRTATDASGRPLPDCERLTPLGRFLRRTSLDELPQLWNVLRGDMSVVGPRPLLPQYLPRYSAHQRRRHEVLPGITGWSQVNGRNDLTWDQRLDLDVWYVDHWSVYLDIGILFLTVITVLRRDGITHPGQATMAEFMGNEKS